MSIVFEHHSYTICLSNKKIYVAKRAIRNVNNQQLSPASQTVPATAAAAAASATATTILPAQASATPSSSSSSQSDTKNSNIDLVTA